MNITLTGSLLGSVLAFAVAMFCATQDDQSSAGSEANPMAAKNMTAEMLGGSGPEIPVWGGHPLSRLWSAKDFESLLGRKLTAIEQEIVQLRTQLQEKWPTRDGRSFMSRSAPRYDYQSDFVFAPPSSESQPYFLGHLMLDVRGEKRQKLALQVDRETGLARIFDGSNWCDYSQWETTKLAELKSKFGKSKMGGLDMRGLGPATDG